MDLREMSSEDFVWFYLEQKREGKTDADIAYENGVIPITFRALKDIHGVETIIIRKNKLGITEEHFRKGEMIGLERRIILRRVRDCGMSIEQAITTPRMKNKITRRRKRK